MNTAENKRLMEHVYGELSKGNPMALFDSLADDIEWTIIGTTPLSGVLRGKQEVSEKLFKALRARLDDSPVVFSVDRFIAEGDSVVMLANAKATSKTGKPYNNIYCIVSRLADGKIKQMTDYIDTHLIMTALYS